MKKNKAVGIIGLLLCVIFSVTACEKAEVIYVYNWMEYIGEDVIQDFQKETGIKVKYDTFDTNESMYAKIKKGGGGFDVIFPSDYMIERMINEDMLETIDTANLPNYENIDSRFKGLAYDKDDKYSVPYMWGTVGIVYNTTMVDEPVDSWDILWDEKYKGQIFMYDSERDTIGLALKRLGYSLNTRSEAELAAATQSLVQQKALKKAYLGEPIKDKMIGNEGALAVMYSGDALYCQDLNLDLAYVIPKEGSNKFSDGMVIPKGAKNISGAEKFIDFMCRPDIAARNSEYIGYSTANSAAISLMDEKITQNPIFSPSDEEWERCEFFYDLGDFKKNYAAAWQQILTDE